MNALVEIKRSFPDAGRRDAAVLYDSAFGGKLSAAIPTREDRLQVLAEGFCPDHSFVATRDGVMLGILGFHTSKGSLTGGIDFHCLRRVLGMVGAIRAALILGLLERKAEQETFLLDGIAVAPTARGGGIGSRLLKAVESFARSEGFSMVRLDVIDTNPGARRLYERLGYAETRTEHFPYLKKALGFSASTTMEFRLT